MNKTATDHNSFNFIVVIYCRWNFRIPYMQKVEKMAIKQNFSWK